MNLNDLWANLPLILALSGGFAALIKKSYGYERDIRHLKRDLPQLSANTAHELEELEGRVDQLERKFDILDAKGQLTDQVFALLEQLFRQVIGS